MGGPLKEEESIDNGFARFNTIITSLKALDEGFSSKNYVRNFLRALHPKWRTKILKWSKAKENKSLALKAKKESSDEDSSTSNSEGEEYAMAVRDFKKFFKRQGRLCGDPNHLIGECPKPPRNYNQRAFVGGTWSDSDEDKEEKTKDENCLMVQASNEVLFETEFFSDDLSSLDEKGLDSV
ncbi:hypothetical protein Tco_1294196 [Tanacetum coccineum]